MNQRSHMYYKKIVGYLLLLTLVLTSALPAPAIAETEETEPVVETTVVETAPEPEEAEELETVEETDTEESSEESDSVSIEESAEETASEQTETSEESSSSSEESGSESSEQEESIELSIESSYSESAENTETSEESTEYEQETTHITSDSAADDSTTTSTSETSADASAQPTSTITNPTNDTTASTSLATSTDTTATSTPDTSVTAVTDGDTTVGTTTTTQAPAGTASTSASSTSPTASSSIATGAAVATANILNVVNTNLTNADGSVVFIDAAGDVNETIDVRNSSGGGGGNGTCTLSSCSSHTTHIDLDNNAEIDNTLVIAADTGNNQIEGNGSGAITTGAAYANANIVNVANANIVDSEYLLLTLNAFGDFNGDLIFPGLTPFLSNAKTTPAISTKDSAAIINDIVTTAVTGENSTESNASNITTGDATTGVSLYNNINTTLAKDNVSVLFRVHGDWNGTVFGLPENVFWYETQQGYLLDVTGSTTTTGSTNTSVAATNTAVINNRISVAANTGGNQVLGTDQALISTGNAYAGANVVNVANANIVGQNWMLAIVNVFGDFNGNVSFGRPDVWVGGAATVPNRISIDTPVTYTYTITNQGDAPASDIVVTDSVSPHIEPNEIADGGVLDTETRKIDWQVQNLDPGESTTVSYEARVTTSYYDVEISNTISASLTEPDDDYINNTEKLTFRTSRRSSSKGNISYLKSNGDKDEVETVDTEEHSDGTSVGVLELTRRPLITTVTNEDPYVTETVVITNSSNKSLPGVVFIDQLYDIDNKLIHEEQWEFGTVLPHEEITVSYDLAFNRNTPISRTYSFDSIFYNAYDDKIISRNGYINHLVTNVLSPAEVSPVANDMTFSDSQSVTGGSSTLARVLGTTTISTTEKEEVSEDSDTPVVPIVASTGNPPNNQSNFAAMLRNYVLFPLLLLVLLYAMFRNRQRITINVEKLQKSYISF